MVVSSSSGTIGEKVLSEEWPNEEGLEAGTTKQKSSSPSLEPVVNLVQETWK